MEDGLDGNLMVAITKLLQVAAGHFDIERQWSEIRMKEYLREYERYRVQTSDDDAPSWPDEFEEEWE